MDRFSEGGATMRDDTDTPRTSEPIDLAGEIAGLAAMGGMATAESCRLEPREPARYADNDTGEAEETAAEFAADGEDEAGSAEADASDVGQGGADKVDANEVDEVDMDEAEAEPVADAEAAAADAARQREEDLRLVEAILFAATEPVTVTAIRRRLGEEADVMGLLHELTERYSTRGVHVVKVGDKWAIRTAPDLAQRLKFETQVPRKLSRAAVETMAIIAYHQPVTRAEIEEIRGVALSKGTLEGLMEQGWIKPGRRREVPGRPGTWITTEMFLSHFGLERLEDLPGIGELRAAGLLDARPVAVPLSAREREEGEADDRPEMSEEEVRDALSTTPDPEAEDEDTAAERVDHLVEDAMERK